MRTTPLDTLRSNVRQHPFATAALGLGVAWLLGPARTLRIAGRLSAFGGGSGLIGLALHRLLSDSKPAPRWSRRRAMR
jgi:hypothetical protein